MVWAGPLLNKFPTISHKYFFPMFCSGFQQIVNSCEQVLWEKSCSNFDLLTNMWERVGNTKVSGFFFKGSSVAKLDEKGRFVLPQDMRYGLVEEGKCEFVIGLGLGGCLTIYRKKMMDRIVEKFQKMQHAPELQRFFTLFFSTLFETECDKVGRISLPATLKAAVGIEKEIVVAGVMDKIELWPKEVYDRNLQQLLSGGAPDLAKMFSLLNDQEVPAPQPAASSPNPLYISPIKAMV